MFEELSAEERDALAAEAWRLGLRAVAAERAKAAEERKPIRLSTLPPSAW